MKKGKTLASLICSVMLSLSLIVGATFALFTSESKVNIAVTSGKVAITASIDNMVAYSGVENEDLSVTYNKREDGSFVNGGTVDAQAGEITLDKIAPMDKVTFDVVVDNTSDIVTKYQTKITFDQNFAQNDADLFEALVIKVGSGCVKTATDATTNWYALQPGVDVVVPVSIELPKEVGNELQNKTIKLVCTVSAVQSNAYTADPVAPGETAKEFIEINSVQDLKDFRDAVNSDAQFQGKAAKNANVQLAANIDLANEAWTPIGPNADAANKFSGTFDGKGYKISNLKVEQGAAYHAAGLFGALNGTLKNLTIENATISSLSSGSATDNGTAVVAGSIYNKGTIENVHVINATVSGNRYVGGISGYTYGSVVNCSVTDVTITATPDNLSGSYDNGDKVGGIAGYFASENVYSVSGNTVTNLTLKGYRDLGAVVGCAAGAQFVKENVVNGATITGDQETGFYGAKDFNANAIVGRITKGTLDNSNTFSNVDIITGKQPSIINNDTQALRNAINAAQANDIIYVSGTFNVDYVITIDNKQISIVGMGATKFVKTGGSHLFNVANGSQVTFQNLTLDGAGLAREGIYVRNNATVTLVDCSIKNTGGLDICVDEASDATHGKNTTSTVNLINSDVEDVAICASPVTSVAATQDTFVNFNYDADTSVGYIEKQGINLKPENISINGNNQGGNGFYVDSADKMANLINKATKSLNVYLLNDVEGNVMVEQKEGVDVVIDGLGVEFDGSIEINGHSRGDGQEKLAITNVNFVSDSKVDFIHQNSADGGANSKRYPHNVTISNCSFTAINNAEVFAIRWRQGYNLTVENCTAKGLYSFMWATGGSGISIDGLKIEDGKNGISVGTSTPVTIANVVASVNGDYGYGIRFDAAGAYALTVENCDITASAPILMRKATGAATLTLVGNNVLTVANNNTYQIIVTGTDFDAGVAMGKPGTSYVINGGDGYSIFAPTATAAKDQSALNSAISSNQPEIAINSGTYAMPSMGGKNVSVSGTGKPEDTVLTVGGEVEGSGSKIVFENLTVKYATNSTYKGMVRTPDITYKDCIIEGQIFLYGDKVKFENCTFKTTDKDNYNVWTYGAANVEFVECTFESAGKSVLIYHESTGSNVTFTKCTFKASAPVDGKAAIEIDSSLCKNGATSNVVINQCTQEGFANGNVSGNPLWNEKKDAPNAKVTVDGNVVYQGANA